MFRAFLDQAGWRDATVTPMSADCSTRVFARVTNGTRSAIAMKAAPDQKTREFVVIDGLLREIGLSAPEIYAADVENGFLLLEDFGTGDTFGSQVDAGSDANALYDRATDVLKELHARFDPKKAEGLPLFDSKLFAEQAGLYLDFYVPAAFGREVSAEERAAFQAAFEQALGFIDAMPRTLLLRDYMLDNVMDAPHRSGVAGVGLFDFQDGGLGPAAYDLASLAEGVRRDVGLVRLESVLKRYSAGADVRHAALFLAAQRHTRILGIFTRLKRAQGLALAEKYCAALFENAELAPLAKIVKLKA